MKVYTILRNLAQGIKNAVSHCDANLQTAKDYTDTEVASLLEIEDLTAQMISGTSVYKLRTDTNNSCIRIGRFLILHAFGNATVTISNAMTFPYVKIPIADSRLLVGGISVNGAAYTLVKSSDFSGAKYLTQHLTSNIANGANIDFWAILLVGGNT